MAERWTRIWWVRPVSSRTRSMLCRSASATTSKCVTAGFPTPAAMSVGLSGSRPTGASMVPVSGNPSPTTTALYRRSTCRFAIIATSLEYAGSPLASTMRPEVSRSRRCTTPGLVGSSPPAMPLPRSALTSVPAGMNHEAGRFVHHQEVLVLEGHGDGYVLRREPFFGEPGFDELPVPDPVRGGALITVDVEVAFPDEALHEATAETETPGGQPVEAFPRFRGFYPEALGRHPARSSTADEKPLLTLTHAGAGSGWP